MGDGDEQVIPIDKLRRDMIEAGAPSDAAGIAVGIAAEYAPEGIY